MNLITTKINLNLARTMRIQKIIKNKAKNIAKSMMEKKKIAQKIQIPNKVTRKWSNKRPRNKRLNLAP